MESIIVGGSILVLFLVGLFFFIRSRKKNANKQGGSGSQLNDKGKRDNDSDQEN
jgi:hypothetical protein